MPSSYKQSHCLKVCLLKEGIILRTHILFKSVSVLNDDIIFWTHTLINDDMVMGIVVSPLKCIHRQTSVHKTHWRIREGGRSQPKCPLKVPILSFVILQWQSNTLFMATTKRISLKICVASTCTWEFFHLDTNSFLQNKAASVVGAPTRLVPPTRLAAPPEILDPPLL